MKELFENLKNGIVYFIENYPTESGLVFMIIGISLLIYQMKKNNSFKMSEQNQISWKALVWTWAMIFISFSYGLILIFKN